MHILQNQEKANVDVQKLYLKNFYNFIISHKDLGEQCDSLALEKGFNIENNVF